MTVDVLPPGRRRVTLASSVGPAYELMRDHRTGEGEAIGRPSLQLFPVLEDVGLLDGFRRVALTGEPAFFESSSSDLKKYFQVTAYRPAPN